MVRALLLTTRALVQRGGVQIYETAGAVSLVVGAAMWAPAAGWAVAGLALLGKSLQADMLRGDDG